MAVAEKPTKWLKFKITEKEYRDTKIAFIKSGERWFLKWCRKIFMAGLKCLILASILFGSASAETNTLVLTWIQPPNFQSTLYESTNLNGGWSEFGVVNPPVVVQPTNPVVFFTVTVAPTNFPSDFVDYSGPPTNQPPQTTHIVIDSDGRQWQFYQGGWN